MLIWASVASAMARYTSSEDERGEGSARTVANRHTDGVSPAEATARTSQTALAETENVTQVCLVTFKAADGCKFTCYTSAPLGDLRESCWVHDRPCEDLNRWENKDQVSITPEDIL